MSYLIIGDIHGQLDALEALIAKAPEHARRIYLGDIIDRGSKSIEALLYVMNDVMTNGAVALLGSHELLFLNVLANGDKYGQLRAWLNLGGGVTWQGFTKLEQDVMTQVVTFLEEMPLYVEGPGFICSHAPIREESIEDLMAFLDRSGATGKDVFVWNMDPPSEWKDTYKIFGHMGAAGVLSDNARHSWGICIDDTKNGNIAGIHWPSKVYIKQSFMESDDEKAEETKTKTEV